MHLFQDNDGEAEMMSDQLEHASDDLGRSLTVLGLTS